MDCSTSDAAEMTIYEKVQQICFLGSSDYGRQYVTFKLRYWTMDGATSAIDWEDFPVIRKGFYGANMTCSWLPYDSETFL